MESSTETTRQPHRRRRHSPWKIWRRMSAPLVFYPVALLTAASAGLTYLVGAPFIPLAGVICLLTVGALVINETGGFNRSRQMRRAYEARRTFNQVEILVLFVLLLGNIFVIALALLT